MLRLIFKNFTNLYQQLKKIYIKGKLVFMNLNLKIMADKLCHLLLNGHFQMDQKKLTIYLHIFGERMNTKFEKFSLSQKRWSVFSLIHIVKRPMSTNQIIVGRVKINQLDLKYLKKKNKLEE